MAGNISDREMRQDLHKANKGLGSEHKDRETGHMHSQRFETDRQVRKTSLRNCAPPVRVLCRTLLLTTTARADAHAAPVEPGRARSPRE